MDSDGEFSLHKGEGGSARGDGIIVSFHSYLSPAQGERFCCLAFGVRFYCVTLLHFERGKLIVRRGGVSS